MTPESDRQSFTVPISRSPFRTFPRSRLAPARRARLAIFLPLVAAIGCLARAESSPPDVSYDVLSDIAPTLAPDDSLYVSAESAIRDQQPWRAMDLLRPALRDSSRTTEARVLLAARAAAAARRWSLVDSLLIQEPWIDSLFEAEGRLLLAVAALERDSVPGALHHAGAVVRGVHDWPRARALVLLGRAWERQGRDDSARVAYDRAAGIIPGISDWLYLRAAGVTADTDRRRKYYSRLRTDVAQARAPWSEANSLERTGGARGAIRIYDSLQARLPSLRLRAARAGSAGSAAEKAALRRQLVALIDERSGTDEARTAVQVLDGLGVPLAVEHELLVARSAARSGPTSRARAGYLRAFSRRRPTPDERFEYGQLLARMERTREAMAQFRLVAAPSPAAGRASVERARLLRRAGQTQGAITTLRAVLKRYPDDTAAASQALMLLGDIAQDAQRDAAARDAYLTLARRYPTAGDAPRARFQAGMLAYAHGRVTRAATDMDSLILTHPESEEAEAARYWSGLAWQRLRDSARAHEQWYWLLWNAPRSYYATAAAERLGDGARPWAPTPASDTFAVFRDLNEAMTRVAILESLGMHFEARLEYEWLAAAAGISVERLLATGDAFRRRGQVQRAMVLGRRAIAHGATDARAWRLVYPIRHADILADEALRRGVDPALVASVIRQESGFNPRAESPVGARGLMQVMPRIGRAVARAERIRDFDVSLLYHPDVNLRIGVVHLRGYTRHYDHPALALAAYNAGMGRVRRWSSRVGGRDPDLFIERIRFAETQNYVRTVLRGREMYRALYWPVAGRQSPAASASSATD